MRILTDNEVDQLAGNGYCYIHTHPREPLNFSDRLQLMFVEPTEPVTGDYELTRADELVLVDTSLQSVTITLPLAARGREYRITKMFPQNAIRIVPTAPDRVLGSSTGVVLYNQYSSLHLKALYDGQWIAI